MYKRYLDFFECKLKFLSLLRLLHSKRLKEKLLLFLKNECKWQVCSQFLHQQIYVTDF